MTTLSRTLALVGITVITNVHALPAWSSLDEAVAIQGYDPVAYFVKNDAVRGSSKFTQNWSAMTWFFSSAEHRDMFVAAPEKYAPQFGGFCTRGVASGQNSRGGGDMHGQSTTAGSI